MHDACSFCHITGSKSALCARNALAAEDSICSTCTRCIRAVYDLITERTVRHFHIVWGHPCFELTKLTYPSVAIKYMCAGVFVFCWLSPDVDGFNHDGTFVGTCRPFFPLAVASSRRCLFRCEAFTEFNGVSESMASLVSLRVRVQVCIRVQALQFRRESNESSR